MSISSRSRRKCFAIALPFTSVPFVLPRSSRKESARIVTTTACSPLTARLGRQMSLSPRRPIVIRSRSSTTSSVVPSARNNTSLLILSCGKRSGLEVGPRPLRRVPAPRRNDEQTLGRLLRHPALQPAARRQELGRHAHQDHRDVVPPAVLISDVDQLGSGFSEIAA